MTTHLSHQFLDPRATQEAACVVAGTPWKDGGLAVAGLAYSFHADCELCLSLITKEQREDLRVKRIDYAMGLWRRYA